MSKTIDTFAKTEFSFENTSVSSEDGTGSAPFVIDDQPATLGEWGFDDSYGYDSYGYDSYGYDSYGYDSYGYDSYSSWGDDSYDWSSSGWSAYDDTSWSAWEDANDWSSVADEYWAADDSGSYWAADAISDDMYGYSSAMEYISEDPTDNSAWSDAYSSAESASWDAWNQSVDAYAAGDYEAASQWEQVSSNYESVADSTWSSWTTATSSPSAYGGSDSASVISDNSYDY